VRRTQRFIHSRSQAVSARPFACLRLAVRDGARCLVDSTRPGRGHPRQPRRGRLDDLQQAAADDDEEKEAWCRRRRASERQPREWRWARRKLHAPQAHDATRRETRARSAAPSLRAQGRRQLAQGYAPSMSGPTEKGDFGRDVLSGTLPRRSTLR
jgi:hypothetical protein